MISKLATTLASTTGVESQPLGCLLCRRAPKPEGTYAGSHMWRSSVVAIARVYVWVRVSFWRPAIIRGGSSVPLQIQYREGWEQCRCNFHGNSFGGDTIGDRSIEFGTEPRGGRDHKQGYSASSAPVIQVYFHTLIRSHMHIILSSSWLKGKVWGQVWTDWAVFWALEQGVTRQPWSGSVWIVFMLLYEVVDQI